MEKKAVSVIMLTLTLIGMLTLGSSAYLEVVAAEEQWVPYVPSPKQVDLESWMEHQVVYVKVSITFYDAAYRVSDLGDVVEDGYEIRAVSEIWDWTGPAALVITTLSHTYNLGELKHGTYTFTFEAWGIPVKSFVFTIRSSDVNNDGLVDIFDLILVGSAFGSKPRDSRWNLYCDINEDEIVDIFDLVLVAVNYGKTYI